MKQLILLLFLIATPAYGLETECRTKLVGWKTSSDMTETDKLNLDIARKECPRRKPKKPCVVEFQKKGENAYRAICGYPRPKII
jgi:hypothetical protein